MRSTWLKDAPFDLTLIAGVTLLACVMGVTAWRAPALFLPLLALHTWCFSFDHVIATFTKLAGAPDDRQRNRFLIWVLPPLVFAQAAAMLLESASYFPLRRRTSTPQGTSPAVAALFVAVNAALLVHVAAAHPRPCLVVLGAAASLALIYPLATRTANGGARLRRDGGVE